MTDKHTDDLRTVREGDTVELTTTEDQTFEASCLNVDKQHADPRSGEIRETTTWLFEMDGGKAAAGITNGLKSSPDDPDFPIHSELWHLDEEDGMGYIEHVSELEE